ncbi:MAG: cbb3-type cytochrome c oxidase subunit 3 [Cyclobacteriaceae bacterium]|nr:cbb3-type cytochrome c oxidase subunit 3 [Cyclobacteriaceae bacterium]MDW8330186.1 cbb3-type cytochrome c oxidase subunit 3 [Cyclobacteriaceae bacterium]
MYKNVLQHIENVSIWPIISLVIFFLFFVIMLWYVFTEKRSFINYMKNLPLDENKNKSDIKSQHI